MALTEAQAIVGGAGIAATGGVLTAGLNYAIQNAAASKAWDRQKNWATRHHIYERTALEAANYNPLLAITQASTGSKMRAPQANPAGANLAMAEGVSALSRAALNTKLGKQATAAADVAKVDAEYKKLLLPEAQVNADFWKSTFGKQSMRNIILKRELPDNLEMAIVRWAYQYLKENPDAPKSPAEWVSFIMEEAKDVVEAIQTHAGSNGRGPSLVPGLQSIDPNLVLKSAVDDNPYGSPSIPPGYYYPGLNLR